MSNENQNDYITVWKVTFPSKDKDAVLSALAAADQQPPREKAPAKKVARRPRKLAPSPAALQPEQAMPVPVKRGRGRPRKEVAAVKAQPDAPKPKVTKRAKKVAKPAKKPAKVKPTPTKALKPTRLVPSKVAAPTKAKTNGKSVLAKLSVASVINKALDEGVTNKDELMARAAKAGFRPGPIAAFWINQIKKSLLVETNGVVTRGAI